MKFKKAIVAAVLAGTMLTITACDAITGTEKENETTYTVKLLLYGGSVDNNLTSYVEGKGATLPTPTMNGYNFDGWYVNLNDGTPVTSISSTDTGAKTFHAKWSLKSYTVTLNYEGGTSETDVTSYTYRTGATLPADVTKTGHTFKGWYDNAALTGDEVTGISETETGDKEFWASWQANTYKIELYLNDGRLATDTTTVTGVHSVNYTYGQGYNLPAEGLTRDGYKFIGWHKAENLKDSTVTAVSATQTGDLKFYAEWEETIGNVTLHPNGGTITEGNIEKYQQGVTTTLTKQVTKANYDFDGWYDNANLTGDAYEKIPATATGDLNFYAKWKPKTYTVTLNLNGGASTSSSLSSYTYGTGATLPTSATRNGYTFKGWYTSASGGTKVTSISSTDTGNKTYYAQWQIISSSDLTISASGGYAEGLFVEIPVVTGCTKNTDYSVKYKLHTEGDSAYKTVDSNLVRLYEDTNIVRADMVGIKAGQYDVQVTANNKAAVKENLTVTAQDRSGYAHFNATEGVGGYNADGTPKSDAQIIYITEATKNSVKATLGSSSYTGIVKILQNLSKSKTPVIIRIVGKISAQTWQKITYTKGGSNLKITDIISQTKDKKGITLASQGYTQAELYALGFRYDDSVVKTQLANLEGKLLKDGDEFDSCWNDCTIESANNVTVEGIGTDAGLYQWGMTWKKSKSIEIKNLTFDAYTEDACSFEGSTGETNVDNFTTQRIWLHNNTFYKGNNNWDVCGEQDKGDGDGSTDFKGVSYVTIAYNHYIKTHKTGLIGGGNDHKQANITFHHNYYEECKSRLPLSRQANMHMYNNYYKGSSTNSSTSISLRANAYAFIEYCYFDGSNNTMIDIQGYDESKKNNYGVAKLYNCQMSGKGYSYSKMPSSELPQSNKDKAHEPFIVTITNRTTEVTTSNSFCGSKNFDVDTSRFYYDSTNKCSKVTNLITSLSEVKSQIPELAGVLKPAN